MKTIYYYLLAFVYTLLIDVSSVNAQKKNIVNYFLELPEKNLKIDGEERNKILKYPDFKSAMENSLYFAVDTIDYRNGYMKIVSTGDGAGEHYELTYFNLSDGDKLIAVNHIQWAMCCEDSKVTFLRYNKGNWIDVTEETILVDILKEFFSSETVCKFVKEELDGQLIYKLPQKGKNIIVQLSETFYYYIYEPPAEGYRFSTKEIEGAIKYNQIELLWDDGAFYAGEKFKIEE